MARRLTRVAIIIFLVVAAIVGAAKAVDYYLSSTCISGFGTYNQACIDGAAVLDLPDKSRKDR